jgi:hypothetical protein
MMISARKVVSVCLLILFFIMPCVIGGQLSGYFPGEASPEDAGGESSAFIAATHIFTQNALESKSQKHKLGLYAVVLMILLVFSLRKKLIYVIKNCFYRIFKFLHYLTSSLLISGQATPLTVL